MTRLGEIEQIIDSGEAFVRLDDGAEESIDHHLYWLIDYARAANEVVSAYNDGLRGQVLWKYIENLNAVLSAPKEDLARAHL